MKQSVRILRNQGDNYRMKTVFSVVTIIRLWFIWNRRNTILNRGSYHERMILWEMNSTIAKILRHMFKIEVAV